MKEVGIGVIGCGAMGMSIVRRVVALDPRLKVKGLYDPDERSVRSALTELGEGVTVAPDLASLLADPEISWVMIASWNSFHAEQCIAAFAAGKHVFCQKPLGLSLPECLRIYQAWLDSGRMFNIGFTLRYSPHYRKVKQLISEGAIGSIISMEFNETLDFNHGGYIMGDWRRLRKNAGTHLLEKCCHDIDLTNWMMDCRVSRVASFGGLNFYRPENERQIERVGKSPDGKDAYRSWPGQVALNPFLADKDIVDNQVAILEYESGARATFHTNCNAAIPERRMYILGGEGTIMANVLTGTIELRKIGFETPVIDESTTAKGGHGEGDDYLARELAQSMLKGVPPVTGMMEGLESAVTCFAIDDALDTGKVVDVAPYWAKVDRQEKDAPHEELLAAASA